MIATLANDMDELKDQQPRVGLVAASASDRGLIGGNWYVDNDKDAIVIEPSPVRAAVAARDLLRGGFGDDRITDLLAVTLAGPAADRDRAIGRVARSAEAAAGDDALIVIVGTGPTPPGSRGVVKQVERSLPGETRLIEQAVPGGFFVDQDALAKTGTTEDEVIEAIVDTNTYADVFAAITVAFARYC